MRRFQKWANSAIRFLFSCLSVLGWDQWQLNLGLRLFFWNAWFLSSYLRSTPSFSQFLLHEGRYLFSTLWFYNLGRIWTFLVPQSSSSARRYDQIYRWWFFIFPPTLYYACLFLWSVIYFFPYLLINT